RHPEPQPRDHRATVPHRPARRTLLARVGAAAPRQDTSAGPHDQVGADLRPGRGMGRAARRDAGPARPRRGDPHARPIPAALGRPLADRPLVHPGRVRGAQASRPGDGVPPCRGGAVGAVELPRVGASGRGRRRALSRPPVATATAPASKDQSQAELHRRMLRQMLLIRRFEEKAAEAYALGKIGGFCHLYIGQEAVAVGSLNALRDDDYVICSYREHGQALERVAAVTDVVEHACSYDLAAELVNGMDALAVYEATTRAVDRARKGGHPTLLEVRTYRFMGHSMSDPLHGVYRTKEEVEEQRKRDPISQLAGKLKEEGVLDEAGLDALDAEVRAETEEAVRFADQSPDPDPAELTTHVLADGWRRSRTATLSTRRCARRCSATPTGCSWGGQ